MKPHETTNSSAETNKAPVRKPYQKPQLQVYGDLTEITQSVKGSKMSDGAGHANKHFTS